MIAVMVLSKWVTLRLRCGAGTDQYAVLEYDLEIVALKTRDSHAV